MDGTTFLAPQGVTPASPAPERTAILVAGMSRSGTSLLAHSLHALGAALPDALLGAAPGNPLGHWEPSEIVALNDAILASIGLSWHDPRPLPEAWFRSGAAFAWEQRIAATTARLYGDAPLLLIKDPRLCRLLPLYRNALRHLGIAAKVILPVRPAEEVARSLASRDGFSLGLGHFLWLRSLVDAERASRGCQRAWVAMDAMMADWQGSVARIGESLRVAWPQEPAEVAASCAPRPHLCHHKAADSAPPNLAAAMAAYAVAQALAGHEAAARAAFDRVSRLLRDADEVYAPVMEVQARRIAAYETSTSWRLTAWLRALKHGGDRALRWGSGGAARAPGLRS